VVNGNKAVKLFCKIADRDDVLVIRSRHFPILPYSE
jgi:hypothetical protein